MPWLCSVLLLVRELDPFSWTMWAALGMNLDSLTVATMESVATTVSTLKMPLSDATKLVSNITELEEELM